MSGESPLVTTFIAVKIWWTLWSWLSPPFGAGGWSYFKAEFEVCQFSAVPSFWTSFMLLFPSFLHHLPWQVYKIFRSKRWTNLGFYSWLKYEGNINHSIMERRKKRKGRLGNAILGKLRRLYVGQGLKYSEFITESPVQWHFIFLAAKAQLNTCTCVSVCLSVCPCVWKLNFSLFTPLYL